MKQKGTSMMLVPWKNYRTWTCLLCGECCKKYYVPVSTETARNLINKYGRYCIEKRNGKLQLRKVDGKCIFLSDKNSCMIQLEKPLACKLWPFYIFKQPKKERDKKLAEFIYNGKRYYVYVDTFCPGLDKGEILISYAVYEAIRLYLRETSRQTFTTRLTYTYRENKMPIRILRDPTLIVAKPIIVDTIRGVTITSRNE